MTTPVIDFLRKYAESGTIRCHMPGHKGRMNPFDITEISGADSLFEADGIIREGELNTTVLYGSTASFWSAGGSTLCIQAMLLAVKMEGRKVIAVRNVHRAFVNASALLGIDVEWILPDYNNGILSGEINPATVEEYLRNSPESALYITSPDYTGRLADIKTLAEICHRYNAVLLVDNAHGGHLAFMPENLHPIALGADMCCDSAHKMLVGLTGSAVLHTSSERYARVLRQYMSVFASTSPSYLILASLDYCNRYIDSEIRSDIEKNLKYIADFRAKFPLDFVDGDPFHIAVNLGRIGFSALECAEWFRKKRIECEYADENIIILLMSPKNDEEDYLRLAQALGEFIYTAKRGYIAGMPFLKKLPEKAMDMRSAFFLPSEEIPVEQAEGRICASVKVPCPPAIPVAVCGEVINRECIKIYQHYRIGKVMVVK